MQEVIDRLLAMEPDERATVIAQLPSRSRVAISRHLPRPPSRLRWEPVEWCKENDVSLWSKQCEVMDSIVKNKRTAVHACHGVGKTFLAACATEWWVQTRTVGNARVVTTAPTGNLVKTLLWGEVGKLHRRANLAGRALQTELMLPMVGGGEYLAAMGRKPADHDTSAFQGVHAAEGVLIVGDEACGLPSSIIEDMDKMLSGPDDRALLIGNPDDSSSYFARICSGDIPGWNVIHIDAFDSPNWTEERVPAIVARSLVSQTWAADQLAKYGETGVKYLSRVRGLFSRDSSETVVSLARVARVSDPLYGLPEWPIELGVDVGAGGDQTVIVERRGGYATRMWEMSTPEPEIAADFVLGCIGESGATAVKVDSIGVGWALCGTLRDSAGRGEHSAEILAVNVSERSSEPERFFNLRSEMWWRARERCDERTWDLSALAIHHPACTEELSWPKSIELPASNKTFVELKKLTVKRHGHSPDHADALNLAFHEPDRPAPGGSALSMFSR